MPEFSANTSSYALNPMPLSQEINHARLTRFTISPRCRQWLRLASKLNAGNGLSCDASE
ncbi:hypothetical protein L5L55_17265 [Shewanella glacialipiscicola]|uniref:hypothetical protein n=1 Tax=Shewanella glacialipiscicola TaxID=614069 RepID=UPI0021DAFAFA|nr:hypothetical protein [Shewanella glacialipiscicola]MCU7996619.1 hypothetical protein [Shewanella glacialipiscicola]MCU8027932.1 hypothetical protein [Shewanella glacialipiscicola]